jgi:hypothetical protein
MRPLDEFACLWNDTRARMPPSAWSWSAWSWPVAAAAGAAMLTLIGTSSTVIPTEAKSSTLETPPASACEEQLWPYLSEACVRRTSSDARPVRVLHYDQAMANAAVGATPWASKRMSPAERDREHSKQARGKQETDRQAIRETSRSRTARSERGDRNRNHASERMFNVPRDAYRAYGYAPY